MTEYLTPKLPTETVAYFIDWSRQLGLDEIVTYTLTVATGTVTIPEQENGLDFIRFTVAGGADGETATFDCEIVTLGEQTLQRTVSLKIAAGVTAITPVTTTKRTLVNMVFEEMGLAGYEFDATPEEQASVMRRMDAIMGELRMQEINLNYNFPLALGGGDLDDAAGIPDETANAVVLLVALRAMTPIGKSMSNESRVAYSQALSALRTAYAIIPERPLPNATIRGAGSKPWGTWQPFMSQSQSDGG